MMQALGIVPVMMQSTLKDNFQPTVAMLEALDEKPHGLVIASPSSGLLPIFYHPSNQEPIPCLAEEVLGQAPIYLLPRYTVLLQAVSQQVSISLPFSPILYLEAVAL